MNEQIQHIAAWLGTGSIDIFGRPFSGKDTQGKILADLFHGELIAGGDILRNHHDPQKIKQVMASGGIIASDFYESMVLPYFSRASFKHKPLILSAVGRASGEEDITMRAAAAAGHPFKAVVYLHISEDEVWRRFDESKAERDRGRRADDRREVLVTRLKKFQERTVPVIEYYRKKGLLIEIMGTHTREQVTQEILNHLENRTAHASAV